jgi:hypothetical protein
VARVRAGCPTCRAPAGFASPSELLLRAGLPDRTRERAPWLAASRGIRRVPLRRLLRCVHSHRRCRRLRPPEYHPGDAFRPRGFAPPRRFAPHRRARACCIPLPTMGFAAFPAGLTARRTGRCGGRQSPRRVSHPSKNPPRRQPHRIPAAVAFLTFRRTGRVEATEAASTVHGTPTTGRAPACLRRPPHRPPAHPTDIAADRTARKSPGTEPHRTPVAEGRDRTRRPHGRDPGSGRLQGLAPPTSP